MGNLHGGNLNLNITDVILLFFLLVMAVFMKDNGYKIICKYKIYNL